MNRKINDSIFGEMEYKFGWFKKEILNLWGNEYEVIIKALTYNENNITEAQRDSYLKLKNNINEISDISLDFKMILFKQNGDFGILCDTSLDEENGFVIIISPKYEVGIQDIFL